MIIKRQACYTDGREPSCYYYDSWWYSPAGYIVKYVLVVAIFVFFFAWFVGGYIHAKRRLKKGLPPLSYHRFLVPRYNRGPPQNHFSFYQNRQQYNQYNGQNGYYGEPLPLYTNDAPPSYQPPAGASKVNPAQSGAYPMGNMPPNMAPPAAGPYPYPAAPQETGVMGGPSAGPSSSAPAPGAELPQRPEQAKLSVSKVLKMFKK